MTPSASHPFVSEGLIGPRVPVLVISYSNDFDITKILPTSTENNNITHFLVSSIGEIIIGTTFFKTERPFETM
jgi:hypothetical protein